MVLRICALLSLMAAIAAAQSGAFMPDAEEQFMDAAGVRNSHFYCLDANQTRFDFPNDSYSQATGALDEAYIWAIFLQYPVLSYLDSMRKTYLIDVIRMVAQLGARESNSDRLDNLMLQDFCIGRVFHYRVSEYEESVLINIYFRNNVVVNPMDSASVDRVSIADFNTYFRNGVRASLADPNNNLVQFFRGEEALAIESVGNDPDLLRFTMTESNAHPFGIDAEGNNLPPSSDPTLRAVIISTSVGARDLDNVTIIESRFADNPRPINLGLEAGDIVFIVFGTFFLAVVGGLTILGFCIHPFFLA